MRNSFRLFLFSIIAFTIIQVPRAQAEIPVKGRALITIIGYGTAGGAILGAASMAFGNSTRAVAQGASLGLYAGILFGAYVLVSHHQKRYGAYNDASSPYRESKDVYGDDYNPEEGGSEEEPLNQSNGFFNRIQMIQEQYHQQAFTFQSEKSKGGQLPPLQINLINYQF